MYNKNQFSKLNDKKVLHKVKKQWLTISIAMLGILGATGAAATTTHAASTQPTPDGSQPQSGSATAVKSQTPQNTQSSHTTLSQFSAEHSNNLSATNVLNSAKQIAQSYTGSSNQSSVTSISNQARNLTSRLFTTNLMENGDAQHRNAALQNPQAEQGDQQNQSHQADLKKQFEQNFARENAEYNNEEKQYNDSMTRLANDVENIAQQIERDHNNNDKDQLQKDNDIYNKELGEISKLVNGDSKQDQLGAFGTNLAQAGSDIAENNFRQQQTREGAHIIYTGKWGSATYDAWSNGIIDLHDGKLIPANYDAHASVGSHYYGGMDILFKGAGGPNESIYGEDIHSIVTHNVVAPSDCNVLFGCGDGQGDTDSAGLTSLDLSGLDTRNANPSKENDVFDWNSHLEKITFGQFSKNLAKGFKINTNVIGDASTTENPFYSGAISSFGKLVDLTDGRDYQGTYYNANYKDDFTNYPVNYFYNGNKVGSKSVLYIKGSSSIDRDSIPSPDGYLVDPNDPYTIAINDGQINVKVDKLAPINYYFGKDNVGSGNAAFANPSVKYVNATGLLNMPSGYGVDPRSNQSIRINVSGNTNVQVDKVGNLGQPKSETNNETITGGTASWDLTPNGDVYIHDGNMYHGSTDAYDMLASAIGTDGNHTSGWDNADHTIRSIEFNNVSTQSDADEIFGGLNALKSIDFRGLNMVGSENSTFSGDSDLEKIITGSSTHFNNGGTLPGSWVNSSGQFVNLNGVSNPAPDTYYNTGATVSDTIDYMNNGFVVGTTNISGPANYPGHITTPWQPGIHPTGLSSKYSVINPIQQIPYDGNEHDVQVSENSAKVIYKFGSQTLGSDIFDFGGSTSDINQSKLHYSAHGKNYGIDPMSDVYGTGLQVQNGKTYNIQLDEIGKWNDNSPATWALNSNGRLDIANGNINSNCPGSINKNNITSVRTKNVSGWPLGNGGSSFFHNFGNVQRIDLSGVNYSQPSGYTLGHTFSKMPSLQYVNLGNINTNGVTFIDNMFSDDPNLTAIDGLNHMNTSQVKNMDFAFKNDAKLSSLDLSGWDTSGVKTSGEYDYDASDPYTGDGTHGTFRGTNGLRQIKLGTKTNLYPSSNISPFFVKQGDPNKIKYVVLLDDGNNHAGTWNIMQGTYGKWDTANWAKDNSDNVLVAGGSVDNDITNAANLPLSQINSLSFKNVNATNLQNLLNNHLPALTALDVSGLKTGNASDFSGAFSNLPQTVNSIRGLSDLDLSNATDTSNMLSNDTGLTSLDLSKWNTNKVNNFSKMFYGDNGLTSLNLGGQFTTANANNTADMLSQDFALNTLTLGQNDDLASHGNPKLTGDFKNSRGNLVSLNANQKLAADIYRKVTKANYTINYIDQLTGNKVGDSTGSVSDVAQHHNLIPLNDIQVPNGYRQYGNSRSLAITNVNQTVNVPVLSNNVSAIGRWGTAYWKFENRGQNAGKDSLTIYNRNNSDDMQTAAWPESFSDGHQGASDYVNPRDIKSIQIQGNVLLPRVANANDIGVFAGLLNLQSFDGSGLNFQNASDVSSMFKDDRRLTSVTNLNARNAKNWSYMFSGDQALSDLDASGFNTANATNMSDMFDSDWKLTGVKGLGTWDVQNVKNMHNMFRLDRALTNLDLSQWQANRVSDMSQMFARDRNLVDLNLSGINPTGTPKTRDLFYGDFTQLNNHYLSNHPYHLTLGSGLKLSKTGLRNNYQWMANDAQQNNPNYYYQKKLDDGQSHPGSWVEVDPQKQGETIQFSDVNNSQDNLGTRKVMVPLSSSTLKIGNVIGSAPQDYRYDDNRNGNSINNVAFKGAGQTQDIYVQGNQLNIPVTVIDQDGNLVNKGNTYITGDYKQTVPFENDHHVVNISGLPGGYQFDDGYQYNGRSVPSNYMTHLALNYPSSVDPDYRLEVKPLHVVSTNTLAHGRLGNRGPVAYWSLDKNGHLLISNGDVETNSLSTAGLQPYASDIKTITMSTKSRPLSVNTNNTTLSDMFSNLPNVTSVDLTNLPTRNVSSTASLFRNDPKLTSVTLTSLPSDSNVSNMFAGDSGLQSNSIKNFNDLSDTITNASGMFKNASGISDLKLNDLDLSNANVSDMLNGMSGLQTLQLGSQDQPGSKDFGLQGSWRTNNSPYQTIDLNQKANDNVGTYEKYQPVTAKINYYDANGGTKDVIGTASDADEIPNTTLWSHSTQKFANKALNENVPHGYHVASNLISNDLNLNANAVQTYEIPVVSNSVSANNYGRWDSNSDAAYWTLDNNGNLKITNGSITNVWPKLTRRNVKHITFANVTAPSDASNLFGNHNYKQSSDLNLSDIDLSGLDTNHTKNMSDLFAGDGAKQFKNLSDLKTSDATNMSNMFNGDSNASDFNLSGWNTSNVSDMSGMFANDTKLSRINGLGQLTVNANKLDKMFNGDTAVSDLDLSGFSTGNASQSNMFSGATKLTQLITGANTKLKSDAGLQLPYWQDPQRDGQGQSNVDNDSADFNVTDLEDGSAHAGKWLLFQGTAQNLNSNSDGAYGLLDNHNNLLLINNGTHNQLSNTRLSSVKGFGLAKAFDGTNGHINKNSIDHIYTSGVKASPSSIEMFASLPNLQSVDARNLDTGSTLLMTGMFFADPKLTSLQLSGKFNTKFTNSMQAMFAHDSALSDLDLSKLNTANVKNMSAMLNGDVKLKHVNLTGQFNTGQVSDLAAMFNGDRDISDLDLSNFNTGAAAANNEALVGHKGPRKIIGNGLTNFLNGTTGLNKIKVGSDTKLNSQARLSEPWLSVNNQQSLALVNLADGKNHAGTWQKTSADQTETVQLVNQNGESIGTPQTVVVPLRINAVSLTSQLQIPNGYQLDTTNHSGNYSYSKGAQNVPVYVLGTPQTIHVTYYNQNGVKEDSDNITDRTGNTITLNDNGHVSVSGKNAIANGYALKLPSGYHYSHSASVDSDEDNPSAVKFENNFNSEKIGYRPNAEKVYVTGNPQSFKVTYTNQNGTVVDPNGNEVAKDHPSKTLTDIVGNHVKFNQNPTGYTINNGQTTSTEYSATSMPTSNVAVTGNIIQAKNLPVVSASVYDANQNAVASSASVSMDTNNDAHAARVGDLIGVNGTDLPYNTNHNGDMTPSYLRVTPNGQTIWISKSDYDNHNYSAGSTSAPTASYYAYASEIGSNTTIANNASNQASTSSQAAVVNSGSASASAQTLSQNNTSLSGTFKYLSLVSTANSLAINGEQKIRSDAKSLSHDWNTASGANADVQAQSGVIKTLLGKITTLNGSIKSSISNDMANDYQIASNSELSNNANSSAESKTASQAAVNAQEALNDVETNSANASNDASTIANDLTTISSADTKRWNSNNTSIQNISGSVSADVNALDASWVTDTSSASASAGSLSSSANTVSGSAKTYPNFVNVTSQSVSTNSNATSNLAATMSQWTSQFSNFVQQRGGDTNNDPAIISSAASVAASVSASASNNGIYGTVANDVNVLNQELGSLSQTSNAISNMMASVVTETASAKSASNVAKSSASSEIASGVISGENTASSAASAARASIASSLASDESSLTAASQSVSSAYLTTSSDAASLSNVGYLLNSLSSAALSENVASNVNQIDLISSEIADASESINQASASVGALPNEMSVITNDVNEGKAIMGDLGEVNNPKLSSFSNEASAINADANNLSGDISESSNAVNRVQTDARAKSRNANSQFSKIANALQAGHLESAFSDLTTAYNDQLTAGQDIDEAESYQAQVTEDSQQISRDHDELNQIDDQITNYLDNL